MNHRPSNAPLDKLLTFYEQIGKELRLRMLPAVEPPEEGCVRIVPLSHDDVTPA